MEPLATVLCGVQQAAETCVLSCWPQIDISGLGHEPEFSEWKWLPLERLPEEVVPFKRGVYSTIVSEFQTVLQAEA